MRKLRLSQLEMLKLWKCRFMTQQQKLHQPLKMQIRFFLASVSQRNQRDQVALMTLPLEIRPAP